MRLAALPSHFHSALAVCHPKTRAYVRLLGPCFKTGRLRPFRQHPERGCAARRRASAGPARHCLQSRTGRAHTPRCQASLVARAASCSVPSVTPGAARAPGCNAARRRLPSRHPSPPRPTDVDAPRPPQVHRPHPLDPTPARLRCDRPRLGGRAAEYGGGTAALNRFPFNDFTCF
jgi:hypothetical protein